MKRLLPFLVMLLFAASIQGQEKEDIYDTTLDGMQQIDEAIKQAFDTKKHVFIQIGGNWCPWCIRFHHFVDDDQELKTLVDENYVIVRLNTSRENTNQESLTHLEFPQRFGYPVFIILDENGKRIHTQNSALLEEDKSYNRDNVFTFFKHWTPEAIDPVSYKKK